MIALYDFVPSHCANCGAATRLTRQANASERRAGIQPSSDYLAGASHTCPECGASYQYTNREELLKASAASGGDLNYYAMQGKA